MRAVNLIPQDQRGTVSAAGRSGGGAYAVLEGVHVATGAVAWSAQIPLLVEDAPASCPKPLGARAFCVIVSGAPGAMTELVARTLADRLAPPAGHVHMGNHIDGVLAGWRRLRRDN